SPNRASSVRLGLVPSIRDGIESWKLELLGRSGAVFRSFPAEPSSAPLPESIPWDGRNAAGAVTEGTFTPALTLIYRKGDIVTVRGPEVTVDFTAPTLAFSAKPSLFSPDNDGVDDTLSIRLEATDDSSVASWSFVVTEPQPPFNSFYQIEGRGNAALTREWDGRSSSGELVQSATDYPYTFRAADTLGNTASIKGKIGVDVLVNRDGDTMRIIVPSIVFRANQADFDGLGSDVVAANNRILRRIAEILNKFPEYRVQVEGHANPVTRTAAEEAEELQPLSERRARATVDFLVGFGVRRDRLSAVGMGGKRPIVPFTDREGWWKNRRVEFILIK
ncbi:MAG: OmpA family protein, partial [Spirochaetaceae bacterium]|nr:OmpA family protein [Spirochaetaceae bacterium]